MKQLSCVLGVDMNDLLQCAGIVLIVAIGMAVFIGAVELVNVRANMENLPKDQWECTEYVKGDCRQWSYNGHP